MKNFASLKIKIQDIVEPILWSHNLAIYQITNYFDFENDILQILVENKSDPNKPLDFDEIIKSNEQVSLALDEIEELNEPYFLEVASAGIERQIKDENELQKAIGAYIHIEFKKHIKNLFIIEGYLKKYDNLSELFDISYFLKGQSKILQFKFEDLKVARYAVKF